MMLGKGQQCSPQVGQLRLKGQGMSRMSGDRVGGHFERQRGGASSTNSIHDGRYL